MVPKQPRLIDMQRAFASAVMEPLTPSGNTVRTRKDGRATRDVLAPLVKPNDRLTSIERLEIYNKQYWFRLFDCLYEDFPGVRAVLGARRFDAMMRAYLEAHPSQSYTLRDLGRCFAKFLETQSERLGRNADLAVDVAKLEWANIVAFDGPSHAPLAPGAEVDPASTRLILQPNIAVLACRYPVDEYLLAVKRGADDSHEVASNAVTAAPTRVSSARVSRPRPAAAFIVVHRQENTVYYKRVTAAAHAALLALSRGATIARACERAFPHVRPGDDFAVQVQEWFAAWMALGWLVRADSLRVPERNASSASTKIRNANGKSARSENTQKTPKGK